jgi:hypothetical protein
MKLIFDKDKDEKWLKRILYGACMSTEKILFGCRDIKQATEYLPHIVELRKKIFEYLEEKDPNEDVINLLLEERNA